MIGEDCRNVIIKRSVRQAVASFGLGKADWFGKATGYEKEKAKAVSGPDPAFRCAENEIHF
jgi:hypothetical protein